MPPRLEHANLNVLNIEATIRFLQTAFPEFRVRYDSATVSPDDRWVHVGVDETYIALNEASVEPGERWKPYEGIPGVNHLGYEVDDVMALRDRLLAAGYEESMSPVEHPYRKRVYFYDPDGNDWEFVEYLTEDRVKRHDYSNG